MQLISETKNHEYVIRLCNNRRIERQGETLLSNLEKIAPTGKFPLEVPAHNSNKQLKIAVEAKVLTTTIRPAQRSPGAKESKISLCPIIVNVVEINEISKKEDKLHWLLITSLDIDNINDVIRVVNIYRKRWCIEEFFKTLKYAFKVETAQLENGLS